MLMTGPRCSACDPRPYNLIEKGWIGYASFDCSRLCCFISQVAVSPPRKEPTIQPRKISLASKSTALS